MNAPTDHSWVTVSVRALVLPARDTLAVTQRQADTINTQLDHHTREANP